MDRWKQLGNHLIKSNSMSIYLVKVQTDIPYPYELEYRVEANSFPTALVRGCRMFKKEERVKGKRINTVRASATKLI